MVLLSCLSEIVMTKFTLPIPDKCIHPNARPHYMQKARATAGARWDAFLVGQSSGVKLTGTVTLQPYWFFRDIGRRIVRDGDNLNAWIKPYLDGLQDAGVFDNDRNVILLPPLQQSVKTDWRLELRVLD